MYIHRHIETVVKEVSQMYPTVIVTGARQVGKSTLLRQQFGSFEYVTLDDLQVLNMARENPSLFFNVFKPPVLVDEIQYEPKLLHYIKMIGDETKVKGQFFLAGSQSFTLMKNVSESLAGRTGILQLFGLSHREIQNISYSKPFLPTDEHFENIKQHTLPLDYWELIDTILKGSYPAIYQGNFNEKQRLRYFNDYLKTYIERDVRQLSQVADESAFLKFVTVVASLTGQQLNYTSIAKTVGKEVNTIKRWISILESCGIVYILQPYFENISKRLVKMPKLYFLDTGLACFLCGWSSSKQLANGAMAGAMFETFAITEVLKSYMNSGVDSKMSFSYYRDSSGREIDLIIEQNGVLHPIEIKLTASPNKKDTKHFEVLCQSQKTVGAGGLICMCDKPLFLEENVRVVPINMI